MAAKVAAAASAQVGWRKPIEPSALRAGRASGFTSHSLTAAHQACSSRGGSRFKHAPWSSGTTPTFDANTAFPRAKASTTGRP